MHKLLICLGCALICFACTTGKALADEDSAGADTAQSPLTLSTITVTSKKRAENVQENPSSVSVLPAQEIEQRRITSFSDLDKVVPNLKIGDSGPGTYSYFGIRGRINGSMDVDPTVTVLVDGVPYDDFFTVTGMPLFDVERVEVLRGPQSTMYGMNSAAGVINIITRKPGQIPAASLGAEVNGGYQSDMGGSVRGSAGGPVIEDVLAMGISFLGNRTGGYVTNDYNDDMLGGSTSLAGRLSAVFTPTDVFDATLNVSAYRVNTDNGFLTAPTTGSAAEIVGQSRRRWKVDYNENGHGKIDSLSGDLTLHLATPWADLYSITALRRATQKFSTERDGTSYNGTTVYTGWGFNPLTTNMDGTLDNDSRSYAQEVRVQSRADSQSPLEWLLGFSYYGFARDMLGTVNRNDMWSPPNLVMVDNSIVGSSYAIFGQATYRFFEDKSLGLTVGLRQEWTDRKVHVHDSRTKAALGRDSLSTTDAMFLPKFGIDYRITPDIMVYATAAKGWRTGGVTPNVNAANTVKNAKYDAETNWTYEIGAKMELFDKRLLLNVAGFYSVYDDFQDEIMTDPTVGGYLSNSGETRISGLEVEAIARITENLSASVDFGYLHANYVNYKTYGADYSGNTVRGVPEYTLGASLQYDYKSFYIRPGVRLVGNTYWDRANEQKQEPYATLNLRAGYNGDNYEIYVYGENLTNTYAFSHASEGIWGPHVYYGTPIRPLQVGMGVNVTF